MNAPTRRLQPDPETACAMEPIQRPGAIQPYGLLYVIDDGTPRAASANAPGPGLDELLDAEHVGRVMAAIGASAQTGADPIDDLRGLDGRSWLALVHKERDGRPSLLALEPSVADRSSPLQVLNEAIADLQAAPDIAASCKAGAAALAAMTGFDRVMAYRFLPDWSGEVVAEHRGWPDSRSFLGLRFPASDIPSQARALYASARVRAIPDRDAEPVPLVGVDPATDLGDCALRAVSPLHLQYLANMGVRASMSVAIVASNGALWGLLACHNERVPLFIGHKVRRAADTLARALAWRVVELEAASAAQGRSRVGDLREALATRVSDPAIPLDAALAPFLGRLQEVADANAFLLLSGPNGAASSGFGSAGASQGGLAHALESASAAGRLVTDRLRDVIDGPSARALEEHGHAGLLAFRLIDGAAGAPGSWVVWLRSELRTQVEWAGNPEKTVSVAEDGIQSLSPRHSFAAWREEVAGRSAAFTTADIAAGGALADALARALLRRADSIERANAELRQRNNDIRFFADAAVHDLREPLWQIQVFSGMLREELAATAQAGGEMHDMAQIVESSAIRMRRLIDDLSSFATVGRRPDHPAPEPLEAIVAEAATDMGELLRACGGTLVFEAAPPPPTLVCDRGQIRRLLQNLFSNAIKYRSPDRLLEIRVTASASDVAGRLRIDVADNGRGFESSEAERVFEPFRRLTHASATEGMGLGLAICRRIADGHGGSITGYGQPGIGARFVIELPIEGPCR